MDSFESNYPDSNPQNNKVKLWEKNNVFALKKNNIA
jgi:hypothetical protein